jgi:hypothetical protein
VESQIRAGIAGKRDDIHADHIHIAEITGRTFLSPLGRHRPNGFVERGSHNTHNIG